MAKKPRPTPSPAVMRGRRDPALSVEPVDWTPAPARRARQAAEEAEQQRRLREEQQRLNQQRQQVAARISAGPSAPAPTTDHDLIALASALAELDSTIFPAWEGTPWEFYGQSWEPRQGSIACGYFVTTTLHQAGLHLQRTLLAKQTSETIIKNLVVEANIRRYRGLTTAEFVQAARAWGPGLYALGLDFHAAFLRVHDNGAVQMVHSSYLGTAAVVREAAESSPALESKYRVLGKLSADDALLRNWLLGRALVAHGATVKS